MHYTVIKSFSFIFLVALPFFHPCLLFLLLRSASFLFFSRRVCLSDAINPFQTHLISSHSPAQPRVTNHRLYASVCVSERCTNVFVEVLAGVRGEPSVGHSPPGTPSHSDTVTKETPPSLVLYSPSARSETKTCPGCSQPQAPSGTHLACGDDSTY